MLPYNTDELLKRGQAMLDQTKVQGSTPFPGSSYDTPQAQQLAKIDPTALNNFTKANPGLSFGAQDMAQYNTASGIQTPPFDASKLSATDIQNLPQAEQKATALQQSIADYKASQTQYTDALATTPQETDLQTQLADIRAKADTTNLSSQAGITETGQKVIPMEFITGQQQAIEQRAQGQINTLASQEKNLLARLGIEQEKRKSKLDVLKESVGFKKDAVDMQQKIQDAIQKQNTAVEAQANVLSDNARQSLTMMLSQFKGLDYTELPPDAQLELQKVASISGVPLGVLISGMKAVKDQMTSDKNIELRRVAVSEKNASNNGTSSTEGGLFSKSQSAQMSAAGLEPGLAKSIYSDIMSGRTLEEVRADLRAGGINTNTLDVFDRVIGISTILKGTGE